jgi:hypothetical protein
MIAMLGYKNSTDEGTMHELDWLEANPDCSNEAFWMRLRVAALQILDSRTRDYNGQLFRLLTDSRVNCVERIMAQSFEEQSWLLQKSRRGKPIRLYQGVGLENLASFVSRTDVKLSIRDVQEGGFARPHLMTATLAPGNVLLRIEDGGRKGILAFPQHLTPVKVEMLSPQRQAA